MEEKLLLAVFGAFVTVIVGGISWLVNHYLAIRLRKRIETAQFLERQIGELYGPLVGLIEHSHTIYGILRKKLRQPGQQPIDMSKLTREEGKVWDFFQEQFFIPINGEIRELIRTKTHLLEFGEMPDSFLIFLEHEAHYSCLHPMWKKEHIDSLHVQGPPWPAEFNNDVKSTLKQLAERHQKLVKVTHVQ